MRLHYYISHLPQQLKQIIRNTFSTLTYTNTKKPSEVKIIRIAEHNKITATYANIDFIKYLLTSKRCSVKIFYIKQF